MELDWTTWVNILRRVAYALAYLHHDCWPSIVHRDISSNNILLNSGFEAFFGNFGVARLLNSDSSNRNLIAGTYRYIAPALVRWHLNTNSKASPRNPLFVFINTWSTYNVDLYFRPTSITSKEAKDCSGYCSCFNSWSCVLAVQTQVCAYNATCVSRIYCPGTPLERPALEEISISGLRNQVMYLIDHIDGFNQGTKWVFLLNKNTLQ